MKNIIGKSFFLIVFSLISGFSSFGIEPVYVSTSGNDSGNGTLTSPFLTLEKARDAIRANRQSGAKGPFSIVLKGGDYYFARTVKFDEQDKDLTIAPFEKEVVRFTGGISIDPGKAKSVAGSNKENIFPKNNPSHILMVNLKELGITDYGELKQVGFAHQPAYLWMELFINSKPGQLARWPNDSTIPIGKVIEKGFPMAKDKMQTHGGKFTYPVNRPSRWKISDDIWIFGYFKYGYADDVVKLASIDTLEKTFTTVQPHIFGFSSGASWNGWYAYNIPEEIDTPGEYYIDRKEGILYFYNPGKIENLEVSVLIEPFITIEKAENITIQGIIFECARGISVDIKSSTQCLLKDCTIRNLGSYAINISDDKVPGKKNGLVNCSIYQTGAGGIHLGGGNRQTLEAAENFVENCSIHDFNRVVKTDCVGIQISGVGNRISHCEIFNAPYIAIHLSGNDHLIEYNDIHDVCLLTDDIGALYYGRNPSERGNLVHYNYFHELGSLHNTSAIYHDDGACGLNVMGNVFLKAGLIPILIGGGSDNIYENNIFIDNNLAIRIDNRLQNWAKGVLKPGDIYEKELNEIKYNKPPYSTRYPELARYWEDNPALPKRNRIAKNVFVRIKTVIDGNQKFVEYSDNNLVTNEDPGFVNEKNQNFKLIPSSVVFKKIPGFQQIPFEKIGIK